MVSAVEKIGQIKQIREESYCEKYNDIRSSDFQVGKRKGGFRKEKEVCL